MIRLEQVVVEVTTAHGIRKKILGPIDLLIETGDWIMILGGNGAGKSTLLNTIAGSIIPSSGKIFINDQDVTQWPESRRALFLARVFQDLGIFSDLTIEENMALGYTRATGRALWRRDITRALRDRFKDALHMLNMQLENRLQTKVSELSGGQRQAVSLIMATLQPSQALLLDEHTSALDQRATAMVLKLTQQLIESQGLTALMITHAMSDAFTFGNRVLIMDQGGIMHDIKRDQKARLTIEQLYKLSWPPIV